MFMWPSRLPIWKGPERLVRRSTGDWPSEVGYIQPDRRWEYHGMEFDTVVHIMGVT